MAGTAAVVTGATLECGHGGVIAVATSARLTVHGEAVLLAGAEAGLSFALGTPACNNTTTDGSTLAPCVTIAATSGTTSRLTVARANVLLGDAGGDTVSPGITGKLTWAVKSPGQSRLTSA